MALILILFIISATVFELKGQTILEPKQLEYSSVGILYDEERAIDIRPHSNGMAIGVQFGKMKTYYRTHYYTFDAGYIKHPKEFKQSVSFNSGNPFARNANSFTYGKQNQFFVARGGVGVKRYYSDKAKRRGVAVGVNFELGATIGILKPYYLELSRIDEGGVRDYISTEKYTGDNADVFLDETKIFGTASFFKGFGELKFVPGAHAKLGAHFSLGAFDKVVKALEVGIMVDGFVKRIPIMIIENNTPVFINGYLSLQLGKRS